MEWVFSIGPGPPISVLRARRRLVGIHIRRGTGVRHRRIGLLAEGTKARDTERRTAITRHEWFLGLAKHVLLGPPGIGRRTAVAL
jgi:hypothetical protein